jgi:hypothetical protein
MLTASKLIFCIVYQQKIIDKESALAADRAYMESVRKQELLEASHDAALVQQAK